MRDQFPLLEPEELKSRLQSAGRKGLALDIDETLARTDHQWLDLFFDRLGAPPGTTKEELIEKYQFIEHMPFWPKEKVAELAEEFLHSNEFQTRIPLIENADRAVNEMHRLMPIAAYVTARPVSVAEGTRSWLARHGFPAAPLILRPLKEDHFLRNRWKASVLKFLYPEVLGIVDDNQGLVDELVDYPGTVFIYNRREHPRAGERVIPCGTWEDVARAVSAFAAGAASGKVEA